MKILLIQLKRIGDLILTTPALAALRKTFPDATIDLVVSGGCAELLPAIPGVDRRLVVRGTLADAANWLALALRRYDYCLDFTRTDRSAFLSFLSGARKRITYERAQPGAGWKSLVYNEFVERSVLSVHTVDHHLAYLEALGIQNASPAISLALPKEAIVEAERILHGSGVHSEFVMFHPGSARIEKFWEAERWAELIDYCWAERKLACVLTGSRTAMEQSHLAEIKRRAACPIVDLSGRIDLLILAAVIGKARLLIGVDSGPTHLAAAMQVAQVVLYGPTNPFHWRPRLSPAVIIAAGASAPLRHFSPDRPSAPMSQISTKQVIDAMESLLSASAAPVL